MNSSRRIDLIAIVAVALSVWATPSTAQGMETSTTLWLIVLGGPVIVIVLAGLLVARLAKLRWWWGMALGLAVILYWIISAFMGNSGGRVLH